ncbi:phage protein NinX family protein [Pseudomonas savastanoi]|uniref:DUF2591 domain-containing protein n=1 Tax=Pseudomonas savastanoi TaxID=29438 RepID=A0AAW3LZP6_PSESS|nr:phage protein NinX family protein [Pseudomonas savastanoi]KTC59087.1 hypothetical protein AO287_21585 [Pseudomonas savastanoi]
MSEFVEVKTADLVGKALDYATAKAAGIPMFEMGESWPGNAAVTEATKVNPAVICDLKRGLYLEASLRSVPWSPSTDWGQGGPLIEKHAVTLTPFAINFGGAPSYWLVQPWDQQGLAVDGPTALVAACRAIVASVLGETVSVPKELLS